MPSDLPTYPERWHEWFAARLIRLGLTNRAFADQMGMGEDQVSKWRKLTGALPPSTKHHLVASVLMVPETELRLRIAQERTTRENETDTREFHAPTGSTSGAA
jgi:hypothetical protein